MRFMKVKVLGKEPWCLILDRVRTRNNKFKFIQVGMIPLATYLARY